MRRQGAWIGVSIALAILAVVAPPAGAEPEQVGPPFLVTGGELACAGAGGFYGPPSVGVPRPPGATPTRSPVTCTSKHAVEKGGLVTAALTAHGTGRATEGSYSNVFSYGFTRHRLTRATNTVRYTVTVAIEDAFADVAIQYRATTSSFVLLVFNASHQTCRGCVANTAVIVADTEPSTSAPERVKSATQTLELDIAGVNGAAMPSGYVGLVIAAFPMVLTGTYASPAEALGSATVRARITRITAAAA